MLCAKKEQQFKPYPPSFWCVHQAKASIGTSKTSRGTFLDKQSQPCMHTAREDDIHIDTTTALCSKLG